MTSEHNFPGARSVICHIIVGDPETNAAEECPSCGFDAVMVFPLTSMSLNGVGPFGQYRACVRCADLEETS